MKIRIISTFVILGAMGLWAQACGTEQARPSCLIGHGSYAVKFVKKSASGPGGCNDLDVSIIGVEKYNRPITGPRTTLHPGTLGGAADNTQVGEQSIALLPDIIADDWGGNHIGGAPYTTEVAQGKLTSPDPDASNFCTAPTLTVSKGVGSEDGVDPSYEFSNIKFYVTPAIPGTQFSGQLTFKADGCSADYDIVGVYPAIGCGGFDDDTGEFVPSVADCGGVGVNYNPGFPVRCEESTWQGGGLCVLGASGNAAPVPAFCGKADARETLVAGSAEAKCK